MKFYFTYGTEGQPYFGGWTVVNAPDRDTACKVFRALHPDKHPGFMNCAGIYTAAEFKKSAMGVKGHNFGAQAHEIISITIKKPERS